MGRPSFFIDRDAITREYNLMCVGQCAAELREIDSTLVEYDADLEGMIDDACSEGHYRELEMRHRILTQIIKDNHGGGMGCNGEANGCVFLVLPRQACG